MALFRNDLVRFQATFLASGGNLVDPTNVFFLTIDAVGARATYQYLQAGASIARSGAGAYYKDLSLTTSGAWKYRWEGTGAAQTAIEGSFFVEMSFKL